MIIGDLIAVSVPAFAEDICEGRNTLYESAMRVTKGIANKGENLDPGRAQVFVEELADVARKAFVLAISTKMHELGIISDTESLGIFVALVTNRLPEEEQAFPFMATIHAV
jgi:hypothetical protein